MPNVALTLQRPINKVQTSHCLTITLNFIQSGHVLLLITRQHGMLPSVQTLKFNKSPIVLTKRLDYKIS